VPHRRTAVVSSRRARGSGSGRDGRMALGSPYRQRQAVNAGVAIDSSSSVKLVIIDIVPAEYSIMTVLSAVLQHLN